MCPKASRPLAMNRKPPRPSAAVGYYDGIFYAPLLLVCSVPDSAPAVPDDDANLESTKAVAAFLDTCIGRLLSERL